MSEKKNHCGSKALMTQIGTIRVYLYRGWDLSNGKGWFCHTYNLDLNDFSGTGFSSMFGFHKTNRFTAVNQALNQYKDLKNNLIRERNN